MGGADKMEIAYSENMFVVDDAAAAIRDYASKGYELVIAHGSQYGSSLQEIAPDFPETSFAWGTTVDTFGLPNVFAYEAASDQGGYVNGVLAASLTKSKVIGVVGPIETGDAKLYVDGFKAGVAATDPDVKVNVNYIGSFSDTALAAAAATTHIAAGADVLTRYGPDGCGRDRQGARKQRAVVWHPVQSDVAGSIHRGGQPGVSLGGRAEGDARSDPGQGTLGGQTFKIDLANGGEVDRIQRRLRLACRCQGPRRDTPCKGSPTEASRSHCPRDRTMTRLRKSREGFRGRRDSMICHSRRWTPPSVARIRASGNAGHHQALPRCAGQRPRRLRCARR